MTNTSPTTLFQNAPDFTTVRTEEAVWNMLSYKLNLFYEQGGQFRDLTVAAFEKSQKYDIRHSYNQNNCYASALGFLVSGDLTLCPGRLPLADRAEDGSLEIRNKADLFTDYFKIGRDPDLFEGRLQQGLKDDGVLTDIPVTSVTDYVPVIGISYDKLYDSPRDYNLDFHFLVPHIKNYTQGKINYMFSGRFGRRGPLEYYNDAQAMREFYFDKSLRDIDVYFASNSFLGQRISVTDEVYADKKTVLRQRLMDQRP